MNIREFQRLMRQVYFHRDFARGASETYEWLVDEVKELGEALSKNDRKGLEEESADVIAWLASLANVTGIDLEKAALHKYPNKCSKCGYVPCRCAF